MTQPNKPVEEKKVACAVCLKEIPASAAKNVETEDYVRCFCGLDCYEKWKKQEETQNR